MNKQMQIERWKSERTSHLPTFNRSMINLPIITFHVQSHLDLVLGMPWIFFGWSQHQKKILPETNNEFAPENGWLEY